MSPLTPSKATQTQAQIRSELLPQTVSFLTSASLILSDCHVVSAHLNRQISDTVLNVSSVSSGGTGVEVDGQRMLQVCGSCGSFAGQRNARFEVVRRGEARFRVPRVARKSKSVKKVNGKVAQVKSGKGCAKEARMKCWICGHTIIFPLPVPKRPAKSVNLGDMVNIQHTSSYQGSCPSKVKAEPASTTAVSNIKPLTRKQRQKQSKPGSSLQAMLQKSKENEKQAKSGFGLDLMDLMKFDNGT